MIFNRFNAYILFISLKAEKYNNFRNNNSEPQNPKLRLFWAKPVRDPRTGLETASLRHFCLLFSDVILK